MRRREGLKPYLNRWAEFSAYVADVSATYAKHPTVLLKQVYDANGNFVAGHTWVTTELPDVAIGDSIVFEGHVRAYKKGWRGGRSFGQKKNLDYQIDQIRLVRKGCT